MENIVSVLIQNKDRYDFLFPEKKQMIVEFQHAVKRCDMPPTIANSNIESIHDEIKQQNLRIIFNLKEKTKWKTSVPRVSACPAIFFTVSAAFFTVSAVLFAVSVCCAAAQKPSNKRPKQLTIFNGLLRKK